MGTSNGSNCVFGSFCTGIDPLGGTPQEPAATIAGHIVFGARRCVTEKQERALRRGCPQAVTGQWIAWTVARPAVDSRHAGRRLYVLGSPLGRRAGTKCKPAALPHDAPSKVGPERPAKACPDSRWKRGRLCRFASLR